MSGRGESPMASAPAAAAFLAKERDPAPARPAPKEQTPPTESAVSSPSPIPTLSPDLSGAGSVASTAELPQGSGESATSSTPSSPPAGKTAPAETTGGDEQHVQPPRRRRCAFSFARRVCALPAVQGAARIATSAYEKVKHSTRVTEFAFSAAEAGFQIAAGPCALAAVPFCVVMAVPMYMADFGLNRTMDLVEYVAPCIKYDSEQAKKAAARVGVRIVTLPESAVAATVALLDTCPGRAVVQIVKTSSNVAGKTVDLLVYIPKSGENAVTDTVFRYIRLPCHVAERIIDAGEHSREALRDRLMELS